jgi:hypothetical protein
VCVRPAAFAAGLKTRLRQLRQSWSCQTPAVAAREQELVAQGDRAACGLPGAQVLGQRLEEPHAAVVALDDG